MIVNANSIVQHVIEIKNGMINLNADVKSIMLTKKITVGSLGHIFVRIVGI